ncbi:MAG: hypothetical protein HOC74_16545 [Gemmatimonadetes bacterium]|nr:hypothetical protein [Gemmatimonadota bacterium]
MSDRHILYYDHPIAEELVQFDRSNPDTSVGAQFMGEALPLGNGHFGASGSTPTSMTGCGSGSTRSRQSSRRC